MESILSNKIMAFAIFMITGTTGFSIPWLIDGVKYVETGGLSIGLITFVSSSISYSATDKLVVLAAEKKMTVNMLLLNLLVMSMSSILAVIIAIIVNNKVNYIIPLIISIVAFIGMSIFWWILNKDNKSLCSPSEEISNSCFGSKDYK